MLTHAAPPSTPTRRRRSRRWLALGAAAGTLAIPAVARADVIAVAAVAAPAPRTDFDIALINANLGFRSVLPAAVNTTADEIHPSLSSDGRRLAFERIDRTAGTVRIVVVDLVTGQAADLFTGFETAAGAPTGAALTPDGSLVATGGPFVTAGSMIFAQLALTDVRGFPAGPFPHGVLRPGYGFVSQGVASSPAAGGNNLFAYTETRPGFRGELILSQLGSTSSFPLANGNAVFDHAAIAATNPQFVLFDVSNVNPDGTVAPGDIAFRPASVQSFVGTPTRLPTIVNTPFDESQPAFTPEGRYVAFVRRGRDNRDRLLVWDSQTQLIVNPTGVDLGALRTREVGSVSAIQRPLLNVSALNLSGVVTARLLQNAGVGILIQGVTGFRTLLGRRRPVLHFVGRVPFGPQRAGAVRVRWDGRVDGRLLRPGVYQVTVRALGAGDRIRDLGRPTLVRLGRGGTITQIAGRG